MELDKFLEKICVLEKVIVELLPRHGDFNPLATVFNQFRPFSHNSGQIYTPSLDNIKT